MDSKKWLLSRGTALDVTESFTLKGLQIGFVSLVKTAMRFTSIAYYKLTVHMPRRLPEHPKDWARLKFILSNHFGVKDDPITWYCVASQVTGTPPDKIKITYASLVNRAKRLNVNELAQDQKIIAGHEITRRMKEVQEEPKISGVKDGEGPVLSVGSYDLQPPVQELPEPSERVVSVFDNLGI